MPNRQPSAAYNLSGTKKTNLIQLIQAKTNCGADIDFFEQALLDQEHRNERASPISKGGGDSSADAARMVWSKEFPRL
jgi:hypothetical protein